MSCPVPFFQVLGALWHLFNIQDWVCQNALGIPLKTGHSFRLRKDELYHGEYRRWKQTVILFSLAYDNLLNIRIKAIEAVSSPSWDHFSITWSRLELGGTFLSLVTNEFKAFIKIIKKSSADTILLSWEVNWRIECLPRQISTLTWVTSLNLHPCDLGYS